jgi:alkanesulfonate monooxygenase SsuD/methylene tetrahydromethanopterin reductase-like flavin-dependent oxidoreductase (luciferase family)
LQRLHEFVVIAGKDPSSFPNGLASMWLYITEDEEDAERMLNQVLAPALNRPVAELRERLPVGSARVCAEKLAAYQQVGVQRIYLWPLADELEQIKIFMEQVLPLVNEKIKHEKSEI